MLSGDEVDQADMCLATTIERTNNLQKMLTYHISATAMPAAGRPLRDVNMERSSLLDVRCLALSPCAPLICNFGSVHVDHVPGRLHSRAHVEALLNKLLEIKRMGGSALTSKVSVRSV